MDTSESRLLPGQVIVSHFYPHNNNGPLATKTGSSLISGGGNQVTSGWRTKFNRSDNPGLASADSGHFESTSGSQADFARQLREDNRTLSGDTGHEFVTTKTTTTYYDHQVAITGDALGTYTPGYLGWFAPSLLDSHGSAAPVVDYPTTTDINVDGAKLINMASPTRSEATLAVMLGELREQFPHIPGQALLLGKGSVPRKGGQEYLNWKFGVQALASDLRKLLHAIIDAHKIVAKFRAGSDEVVRRKRRLYDERKSVDQGIQYASEWMSAYPGSQQPSESFYYPDGSYAQGRMIDIFDRSCWFSGAFVYHLSEAHGFLGRVEDYARQAEHLLGFKFDVETLWNLAPWTWLADWFADFGTFVSNVNMLANDALVVKYGYVMHHTRASRVITMTIPDPRPGISVSHHSTTASVVIERKQRTRATPYGFGLDTAAFTGQQWAVLGALGLSKGPGLLRRI